MRVSVRRLLIVVGVSGAAAIAYLAAQALAPAAAARTAHHASHHRPTTRRSVHRAHHHGGNRWPHVWAVDAQRGVREFLGGDRTRVGWSKALAEWGGTVGPHWWQSALAILTLVKYAEQTNSHNALLQHVIDVTYKRGVRQPHTDQPFDFINQYMDDNVWWGLAWLNASQYELYYRHNLHDATRFLRVAEKDATWVAHKRQCGGIVWSLGSPAGTITNAEYVALTAELSQYRRTSATFHDPGRAARWLSDARGALRWLQRVKLVNLRTGTIKDSLAPHQCHTRTGGPLAYSEGEVADALVQLGTVLNDPSYYRTAARFLRYVLRPSNGWVVHGVLQEHCEAIALCTHNSLGNRYDVTAFKGIFIQAVTDWTAATGSHEFDPFLKAQARAVVRNAIRGPAHNGVCPSAHSCQFGFSWARPFRTTPAPEQLATVGTQESALTALTAVLP
jgi:glycosyl hydrolase family 76